MSLAWRAIIALAVFDALLIWLKTAGVLG